MIGHMLENCKAFQVFICIQVVSNIAFEPKGTFWLPSQAHIASGTPLRNFQTSQELYCTLLNLPKIFLQLLLLWEGDICHYG